ncbi:hypothetical protein CFOL_v3_10719 [Cephalotus follicularis]|uniref:DUF3741 domain-containing protein n=1 Tax=Cephalotus follicularis TaxID=3775 RepID=A0A1Q3BGW3_CEPFO|nr:hypothetical protein CFOL_v3_10719 [Cephalotus follicularis]
MKDLSFFLLKTYFGAKMKKGMGSFCNGDGSTSTLNQQNQQARHGDSSLISSDPYLQSANNLAQSSPTTLEEMILQLELEEELTRKVKLNEYAARGRMSCVNNSDILRSARNALNQYPRFSLDGKDAMYRSSFRNLDTAGKPRRKSVCCDRGRLTRRFNGNHDFDTKLEDPLCLPPTLAGESVVWCKPGVIAKLMGLEAVPVPISGRDGKEKLSSIIKRQKLGRIGERHGMQRRIGMDMGSLDGLRRARLGYHAKAGYCVMKPVAVEAANGEGGWPTRHFL